MTNSNNPFETFEFDHFYLNFMNAMNEFAPQNLTDSFNKNSQLVQTFSDQIKLFYKLVEKISVLITEINNSASSNDDKKKHIVETLLLMQKEIDESNIGPIVLWENIAKAFGNNSFQFNQNSANPFEQYFNLPALGFTREQQENYQKGKQLWELYQKALTKYGTKLKAISLDANQILMQKLYSYVEEDKKINSLREIYDLWIEVNEEKYAEYVITEEHSLLYGELINALMRVKQFINKNMDDFVRVMNLPTQTAMNAVLLREKHTQKKLQELQQELKNIKSVINNEEIKKQIASTKEKTEVSKKKTANKTIRKKVTNKKIPVKKKVTGQTTKKKVSRKKKTNVKK